MNLGPRLRLGRRCRPVIGSVLLATTVGSLLLFIFGIDTADKLGSVLGLALAVATFILSLYALRGATSHAPAEAVTDPNHDELEEQAMDNQTSQRESGKYVITAKNNDVVLIGDEGANTIHVGGYTPSVERATDEIDPQEDIG